MAFIKRANLGYSTLLNHGTRVLCPEKQIPPQRGVADGWLALDIAPSVVWITLTDRQTDWCIGRSPANLCSCPPLRSWLKRQDRPPERGRAPWDPPRRAASSVQGKVVRTLLRPLAPRSDPRPGDETRWLDTKSLEVAWLHVIISLVCRHLENVLRSCTKADETLGYLYMWPTRRFLMTNFQNIWTSGFCTWLDNTCIYIACDLLTLLTPYRTNLDQIVEPYSSPQILISFLNITMCIHVPRNACGWGGGGQGLIHCLTHIITGFTRVQKTCHCCCFCLTNAARRLHPSLHGLLSSSSVYITSQHYSSMSTLHVSVQ